MTNLETALELCTLLEAHLAPQELHVGLTGGTLYKDGERKDIDLLVYTERQIYAQPENLFMILLECANAIDHLTFDTFHGFVSKMIYKGVDIDVLYPEYSGAGTYPIEDEKPKPLKLTDLLAFPK